jgi:hypothetical protein
VQGGALLNGSTHSDNSAVITNSNRSIKWSGADLDSSVFEFNASHPTRLQVKVAGDYFVSLNAHSVENSNGGGNHRTQHRFVLYKNGSVVPQGKSNCTYVRHSTGHTETSGHINVLVPGLSANDYFEIFTGIDYADASTVKLESVRLFAEKVAPSRTVFSALSNRTSAHATELRHNSLTPLVWDHNVSDAGFTHSDSSNAHQITLDSAGKYLVYINLPLQQSGSVQRATLDLHVKVAGSLIAGGVASQGYIRLANSGSSLHWVGMVSTSSSNQILTTEVVKSDNQGDTSIIVPANTKASIFIEKLSNANKLFSATATQTTYSSPNDWNKAASPKWATQETMDGNYFTHSTSSNAERITIDKTGDYLLLYNDELNASTMRDNPKVSVMVNSKVIPGAVTATHYIRNSSSHDEASGTSAPSYPI